MDKNYIAQLYNDKVLTSVGVLNAIQKGWITTEDAVEILGSDTALDTDSEAAGNLQSVQCCHCGGY